MNKMLEGYKSEKELGLNMLAFEIEQAKKNLRPAPPNISMEIYQDKIENMSPLAQACYKQLPRIGGKSSRQIADRLGLRDRRSAGNALRNLERNGLAKVAYERAKEMFYRRL